MSRGWIGFDLDGTLAQYDGRWKGPEFIGEPITQIVETVKKFLADGVDVRIFTARVYWDGNEPTYKAHLDAKKYVEEWSQKVFGVVLPVTCTKDFSMIQLWDDRAVQVMSNAGQTRDEFLLAWFSSKLAAVGLALKTNGGDFEIVPIEVPKTIEGKLDIVPVADAA